MDSGASSSSSVLPDQSIPKGWLEQYYKYKFPFNDIWKRFVTTDETDFEKGFRNDEREFIFVTSEIWSRYNFYSTKIAWRDFILRTCPQRIELGAIYNVPPDKALVNSLKDVVVAKKKELVFDVDANDYQAFRTNCACGQEKKVCSKCWTFIYCTALCLDYTIRNLFGFKELLFVFSGRRGLHCWISDKVARDLSNFWRKKIVDFFEALPKLYEEGHPHAVYMYEQYIEKCYRRYYNIKKTMPVETSVCIQSMRPRLDANVTRDQKHPVKCPFVIHPSTGNVCVPLNMEDIAKLNPDNMPNIMTIDELDDLDIDHYIRILRSSSE